MDLLISRRVLALAIASALAGCSAAGTPAIPSAGLGSQPDAAPSSVSAFLYVLNAGGANSSSSSSSSGNTNGSLAEFRVGRPHLLNVINDGINTPRAMTFDNGGNVYVANASGSSSSSSSGSNGNVTVYVGHGSEQLRTITEGISEPDAVAVDGNGTLYVANLGGSSSGSSSSGSTGEVTVYRHGRNHLSYPINAGISSPRALAVDAKGNLYVLNGAATSSSSSSSAANGSVSIYPPKHRSPSIVLTTGIDGPVAMAVDSAGDVFVANGAASGSKSSSASGGSVVEFTAGSRTPAGTITNGIAVPRALAIDGNGTLYVANLGGGSSSSSSSSASGGSVSIYPSGETSPDRIVTDGVTAPTAIATAGGFMFVANGPSSASSSSSSSAASSGDVQVYPPGHSSPRFTITHAISIPIALGVH